MQANILRLWILLLICISILGFQKADVSSDSSGTEVRIPSEERLLEISLDERYFYQEVEASLSLWDRFMMWLMNLLGDWVSVTWVEWFLKATAALAFIAILVLLINQISKGELKNAFIRRQNRTILDLRLNNKEVGNSQLDELINSAVQNKQFGMAVRYLYQKALVVLRESELIHWKQDKTNHEYLQELGNHPAASSFDRLTYFHDYVDYGDFSIDEPRFVLVQKVYQQFLSSLNHKQ